MRTEPHRYIPQGEGGEQGDALMPLLFAVGQHAALVAAQGRLQQDERILTFLDDMYTTSDPDRVGAGSGRSETPSLRCIGVDCRKRTSRSECVEGSDFPTGQQGIKVLGTPWDTKISSPPTLMAKSKSTSCSCPGSRSARLAISLGGVGPLRQCPGHVLAEGRPIGDGTQIRARPRRPIVGLFVTTPGHHDDTVRRWITRYGNCPLSWEGWGCRSALRPAYWASWGDCLSMVRARHSEVVTQLLAHLQNPGHSPCLDAAVEASRLGWSVWVCSTKLGRSCQVFVHLLDSQRLPVERQFRNEDLFGRLAESERALVKVAEPGSGIALSTAPLNFHTRIHPHLFRVLMQRRFRFPLPPWPRLCRCGRQLDSFGHHRTACAWAGWLVRRGFAVESAAARVCREAGGRVTTNMLVRELDLYVPVADARRLEVVADGLPLFWCQSSIATVQPDPEPPRRMASSWQSRGRGGADLSRVGGPPCQSTACGSWSEETRSFVSQLAKARGRKEPAILRWRAEQAWRMRWMSILGCSALKAFASSLQPQGRRHPAATK